MKQLSLRIEPLTAKDLHVVPSLQPDGWPDILQSIEFYCGSDFCFPLKASLDGVIVGIGAVILHFSTAWLAHIIVSKDYRSKGIGTFITQALIDLVRGKACHSMQLVATSLGEPVYKKLGFEVDAQYIFFDDSGTLSEFKPAAEIIPAQRQHGEMIFQLDQVISGEDRRALLKPHVPHAKIITNNGSLEGVYLPTLGEGLIQANTPEAGMALMKLRAASNKKFCIPANNEAGVNLLLQNGFKEIRRASRMILGDRIAWDGSKIYGRIGGNLG
jgi:GNAT superfamily N-acetyltransferase